MIELSTHESIREIDREEYQALFRREDPPYLRWDFLEALEATGCAVPDRGWLPMHLAIREGGVLVGVAPAYLKGNSDGEFVFDHGWAQFAHDRLGIRYYPKLIVAAPFTPATGPRVLLAPGVDAEQVLGILSRGLVKVVEQTGISSAHVLFPEPGQAQVLADTGLVHRLGLQYHWHNPGYDTFDDFLARFSSKRRHQIRRERRDLDRQGTVLETLTGQDIQPEHADLAFEFYLSTVDKYFWGRQYLTRDFFHEICRRMPEHVMIVLARDRPSGRAIGGAFNLLGARALYGRYWGTREERPYLHFNVCYYHGIDECIRRGLAVFEPGAGGEHKRARGFEPTVTHSLHHLADPRLEHVVRDFCDREARAVQAHVTEYRSAPMLKPWREQTGFPP